MPKISILALTMDRYDIMVECLGKSISNAGCEYELLVCDNGSSDKRVIDWVESKKPVYFRKNKINEGTCRALNQLYLRSTGNIIATLGNDITMPNNWLSIMSDYALKVVSSGLVGCHCVGTLPPLTTRDGIEAHYTNPRLNRVFSNIVFRREVVKKIGLFSEDFYPYGLGDSDFCERCNMAGFSSFYVPGLKSTHHGHDVGSATEYRKMKDESLQKAKSVFNERCKKRLSALVEPLPLMRDPT